MSKLNLGFVGYGNMAQAIATGLITSGKMSGDQIYVCAANYDKLCANASKIGAHPMKSAAEVIGQSDFVVLSVKPNMIEEVVTPVRELLKNKVVVSVAAGCTFDFYEKILAAGTHHISTVPNTPVAVAEGIWVCENKHSLSEEDLAAFRDIFGAVGLIEMVDTTQLSIAGTISGCTPAFTAMYIEALADAGVKYGLSRPSAYRMAAKMLAGTGKLYLENNEHPGAMKDAVCSPGGTTIRGVASLEKHGFRGSIIEAVDEIEGK